MKKLVILSLAICCAISLSVNQADAQRGDRKGHRYQTTYRNWDRGFTQYYGYREERCEYTTSQRMTVSTCYEFDSRDYLYVEERNDGYYSQVTVYRDSSYSTPYVTYYTYDDGFSHRGVGRRHFHESCSYYHRHPYYYDPYYTPYYHSVVWVTIDWDNGWHRIMTGAVVGLVGADLISNAKNDTDLVVGVAVLASGASSSASGIEKIQEDSRLQKAINQTTGSDPTLGTDIR